MGRRMGKPLGQALVASARDTQIASCSDRRLDRSLNFVSRFERFYSVTARRSRQPANHSQARGRDKKVRREH
jgi:hypothetical protein